MIKFSTKVQGIVLWVQGIVLWNSLLDEIRSSSIIATKRNIYSFVIINESYAFLNSFIKSC